MNKAPRFKICLLVLCALLFVGACKKASKKVLLSSDERFEIAVPGGWKSETNLHEDAQVQASHQFSNQFLLVIGEDKGDFDDLNLDEYCDITIEGMKERLKKPNVGDPIPLVIDKKMAIQREVAGVIDHLKVIYLHTCIESPKYFYQIISWTTATKFKKYRENFEKIAAYFKEFETKGGGSDGSISQGL